MTKAEKRADFEVCISLMKSRARYFVSIGDSAAAARAMAAVKRFTDQLKELNNPTST